MSLIVLLSNVFIFKIIFFIYLIFGCTESCVLLWAFSNCGEWGLLFVMECGLLLRSLLLLQGSGSRAHRLGSCGAVLIALRPLESSWTRDWTHVPCIERQITGKFSNVFKWIRMHSTVHKSYRIWSVQESTVLSTPCECCLPFIRTEVTSLITTS